MNEASKSESVSAQKRVFVKWILLNLSQDQESFSLSEDTLSENFKDGKILKHLLQILTGKKITLKSPQQRTK